MHKPRKRNLQSAKKTDWLEYINDCLPGLVIPVGSRFQADVSEWTGCSKEVHQKSDSETSKWLGTRIWPPQDRITVAREGRIGKGRSDSCRCPTPGSPHCVKQHVSEERKRLISELGPAYKSWKFDEMGDEVAKSWSSRQVKKFESLVKGNPLSEDKSFLKPAELSFPSKTRKDIVSYYLNVHVPKRISTMTRSGCQVLDSDVDEVKSEAPNAKNSSLKRPRPQTVDSAKLVKSHYLTGRR